MMNRLIKKYGPWALITGASSGIGEMFARELGALGFNLILVARRKNKMGSIAKELKQHYKIEIEIIELDLSRDDFINKIEDTTVQLDIGLLVNNAGFALTGEFTEHSLEDELRLFYVNCRAPLVLAHYFGKRMVSRGKGGIINVSSASAFSSLPYWSNYAASKSYLLHLSEGLWYEMKPKGVDVLALCPGATQTGFAKVAGTNMKGMSSANVVKKALHSIGKKTSVIVGFNNRFFVFIMKFMPRKMVIKLVGKVIQRSWTGDG